MAKDIYHETVKIALEKEEIITTVLEINPIKILVFDSQKEEIVKWIE